MGTIVKLNTVQEYNIAMGVETLQDRKSTRLNSSHAR